MSKEYWLDGGDGYLYQYGFKRGENQTYQLMRTDIKMKKERLEAHQKQKALEDITVVTEKTDKELRQKFNSGGVKTSVGRQMG